MLKLLRFSCRQAFYEYRAKQWHLILLALIFAVMLLSGVQFVANRVQTGLEQQSAKLLGGDLVVESSVPISASLIKKAKQLQLRTAEVVVLQTMLTHKKDFLLVNLQAVSSEYPLLGDHFTLPAESVLINTRIKNDLRLTLPANIKIGSAKMTAIGYIPPDLELSYSGWLLAPRIIIHMRDLAATKTVLPGSRATYRLLLAGERASLVEFFQYARPLLSPQQKLLSPKEQRFQLLNNLNIIIQFVQLAVIIGVILCGVTISLSVRQYVLRHHQQIALWHALGASSRQIRLHYVIQLALAAMIAMLIGVLIGYYLHLFLIDYINPYFNFIADTMTLKPFIMSGVASFVILFCYAYPYIQTLSNVSALEIWRDTIQSKQGNTSIGIAAFVVFVTFILVLMNFTLFSLFILNCLTLAMALFILASIVLFSLLKQSANWLKGAWYRGIKQLIHYPETSSTQISALALVLLCLFLLHFLKMDLLSQWQSTIKKNAPNFFAFNIADNEVATIKRYFNEHHQEPLVFYPMIRGRLIKINQVDVFAVPGINTAHNALHRDLNLSASDVYPDDNEIISGNAWTVTDRTKRLISVEASLAEALHLKLGDTLTFLIDNQEIAATVSNIRKLNWSSMHPNFYVIFPSGSLPEVQATYITSFHLSRAHIDLMTNLLKQFPNITVIDMADILVEIQDWIYQASSAMQLIFIFTLIAAIMVLVAAVIATGDERREMYTLIKTLGGTRGYIVKSVMVEGIIVVVFSVLLSYAMARLIFYFLIRAL